MYRVLDLTDYRAALCGKILAETGWDVIKIEKPGGKPGRRLGPFYKGDGKTSLLWSAFNTSKKGITLDIEKADGRALFRRLAAAADVVVESFPPGYMEDLGLGYPDLDRLNPRIILTSITPFGQDGPYRDFKAAHVTLIALSGLMNLLGDPDRPPVQPGFPLAYVQASGQAAAATLIAHYARERDGRGQHVDVSMQQSGAIWPMHAVPAWHLLGEKLGRAGQRREGRVVGGVNPRYIWPCKNGFVSFTVSGGPVYTRSLQAIVRWMDDEGMANDFLRDHDWTTFDMLKVTQEELDRVEGPIQRFLLTHTKDELARGAAKRRMLLLPVADIKDIAKSPQLKSRGFWAEVRHEELGASLTYPGFFARTAHLPCEVRHRAPLIGEHNNQIYREELGLSEEQIRGLVEAGII